MGKKCQFMHVRNDSSQDHHQEKITQNSNNGNDSQLQHYSKMKNSQNNTPTSHAALAFKQSSSNQTNKKNILEMMKEKNTEMAGEQPVPRSLHTKT